MLGITGMKHIKPLVIGVIGGSGSGKTYFANYVQDLTGGLFIEGDAIGHEVLLEKNIQAQLVTAYGDPVIKEGQVDRKMLGSIVFNDRNQLEVLNKIMHPVMKEIIRERINNSTEQMIVLEAAVMIEAGFSLLVDVMVYVTADEAVRLERLTKRRGIEDDKAQSMINSGRADYRSYSQVVLDTTYGIEILKKELDGLIDGLLEAMNEITN